MPRPSPTVQPTVWIKCSRTKTLKFSEFLLFLLHRLGLAYSYDLAMGHAWHSNAWYKFGHTNVLKQTWTYARMFKDSNQGQDQGLTSLPCACGALRCGTASFRRNMICRNMPHAWTDGYKTTYNMHAAWHRTHRNASNASGVNEPMQLWCQTLYAPGSGCSGANDRIQAFCASPPGCL